MKPIAATPFLILEMLSMPHTILASENLSISAQTSTEDHNTPGPEILSHFNSFLDHNLSVRRSKDSKLTDPLMDLRKQVEASPTNSSQESPSFNQQDATEPRSLAAKAKTPAKLTFKKVSRESTSWNSLDATWALATGTCQVRSDVDISDLTDIQCPQFATAADLAAGTPIKLG